MSITMPQEVEVWYLLPAVRKALTQVFIKQHKLKQKEVAAMLGITEAAVSQYASDKRGAEMKFSRKEQVYIKAAAAKMVKDPENVMRWMYNLCQAFKGSENLCKLHHKHDKSLPKDCDICMQN